MVGNYADLARKRWAFWINLPLCAISLAVSIWLLPLKGVSGNIREKLARIDYTGSALTVVSSVLILVCSISSHDRPLLTYRTSSV